MRFTVLALLLGTLACNQAQTKVAAPKPVMTAPEKDYVSDATCDEGAILLCEPAPNMMRIPVQPYKRISLASLSELLFKIDEDGIEIQGNGWYKYCLKPTEKGESAWLELGPGAWVALTHNGKIFAVYIAR